MAESPNRDRSNPEQQNAYPDGQGYPYTDPAHPHTPYPPHYDPALSSAESAEEYNRRRQELQLEAEQRRLIEEERRNEAARRDLVSTRIVNGVYYLVGALEALLILRFVLRLSGANIDNTFAQVIYGLSDPFAAPFSTLFISPTFAGDRYIFDVNLLVAIVVYALLGLLVGRLIQVIAGDTRP